MHDLLLGVEDFDISASVSVSYFYCGGNNASELQVSIIIGVCLKKIQFVPKAILKLFVWEKYSSTDCYFCVPVCCAVVCCVTC